VSETPSPSAAPKENQWLNLLCNVILPPLIFMKLSPEDKLGPVGAVVLGCSLPLGYGIYDYCTRRVFNLLSLLGLFMVLIKGIFSLLKASAVWQACSEAVLPICFAAGILITIRGKEPLVQRFLLSPQIFDVDRLRRLLALRGNADRLRPLMVTTSVAYSVMMFVVGILNFVLALAVLKAEPGTPEYISQLGRFNWLQHPVITLPLMVSTVMLFLWLMKRLSALTGVPADDLLASQHQTAPPPDAP
jgi:hypothetical protein